MRTENLPKVGDIITSPKFAFGYYNDDKKFINVDGTTKEYHATSFVSEDERVALAAKSGKVPPKTRTVELGAYDPSRATAQFVVEVAHMQVGGTGHGLGDVFPDDWHVRARRLNEDGGYDPQGEVIRFNMLDPTDVKIVGKMQMRFI